MTLPSRRTVLVLVGLSLLRLWLATGQSTTALVAAPHDDTLFMRLAQHIAEGDWLGPFDNVTLIKGPFYPLWIAAMFLLGVPLALSQNLLYIGACLVTIVALKPVVRSPVALVSIYALLLFNPIMFGITRLLREAVYAPLTLLLAGCLIGLFVRRAGPLPRLATWAAATGVVLGAMWLAREESLWIVPSVAFVLASAGWALWWRGIDRLWSRWGLLVSPVAIVAAGVGLVSTVNLIHYGAFMVTETGSAAWLGAYGALSRVEHDTWQRFAVAPRPVRDRIYRVSSAFAELRPAIEGDLGRIWGAQGCGRVKQLCGDIGAGWFWVLVRDAVARAGYYHSPKTAAAYYRRLAGEVNAACASGALRCRPPRATMTPPWRNEYVPLWLASAARAMTEVVRYGDVLAAPPPSDSDEVLLLPFRLITRDRLTPAADAAGLRIQGWGFSLEGHLLMTVEDSAGVRAPATLRRFESPDVFEHFVATEGRHFDVAREARFTLWTPCRHGCRLVLRSPGGDRVYGAVPLDGRVPSLIAPDIRFYVESVVRENDLGGARRHRADALKLGLIDGLVRIYGWIVPVLTAIVIVALVAASIASVSGYRSRLLVPLLALTGAVVVRIGLIAFLDATSFFSIGYGLRYLSPAQILLPAAGLLACVEVWSVWRWRATARPGMEVSQ